MNSANVTEKYLRRAKRYFRILMEDFPIYVRSSNRKPLEIQLREIGSLYRLHDYIPYQYLKHGLYNRDFGGDIRKYVPTELLHRTRDAANAAGDPRMVNDKFFFETTMRAAGVPTTRTHYLLDEQGLSDTSGKRLSFFAFVEALDTLRLRKGIIVKPMLGGSGSAVFRFDLAGGALRHQGETLDESAFLSLVRTTNHGHFWKQFVVQETLLQHNFIDRLNATSVNTVRIDTFVDDGGAVHFNAAALKVGAKGSITDTYSDGGYMIAIDLATGRLANKAKIDAPYGGGYYDIEELFGLERGAQIPFWNDLRLTARRAAETLTPFRSIGWDIAVSEEGPVVLEANDDYGIDILQELAGGYLDTALGQAYQAKYGVAVACQK